MAIPDHLLELFRRQWGLTARFQLRQAEPSEARWRRIRRHPEIELATPRVLRHRAAPWTPEQELLVAVLDAGPEAVLWGKSAACQWGFGRFPRLPAHVATLRRGSRASHMGQIHRLRSLEDRDTTQVDAIPIARPEVIVLWLAGMWTHRLGHDLAAARTAVALDQAWRQRLIDGVFIHDLAARSGGFGRSGIVVLRDILESRPPDYQPAGSHLEERFEDVVPSTVRRELRRQVTVDIEDAVRIVDYRLDCWPLVVEINGEAFHSSLTDREADERRYARLLELGYSVVVFWEYDIWNDPMTVRDTMLHLLWNPDLEPTLHRPTRAPWEP